jgi:hypothetical protein
MVFPDFCYALETAIRPQDGGRKCISVMDPSNAAINGVGHMSRSTIWTAGQSHERMKRSARDCGG